MITLPLIVCMKIDLVLVLGDWSVGKTSLIRSYLGKNIDFELLSTSSIEIHEKILGPKQPIIQIYDTQGKSCYFDELHKQINQNYQNFQAIIFIFDLNSQHSLQSIKQWKNSFQFNNALRSVLIGNKCDLQRKISIKDIKQIATSIKIDSYYETTIKSGKQFEKHSSMYVFDSIIREIFNELQNNQINQPLKSYFDVIEKELKENQQCTQFNSYSETRNLHSVKQNKIKTQPSNPQKTNLSIGNKGQKPKGSIIQPKQFNNGSKYIEKQDKQNDQQINSSFLCCLRW